jgi:NAD-dependent dihydropyrimidine dehydrogenase PreA subunit
MAYQSIVEFSPSECIVCEACIEVCPSQCFDMVDGAVTFDGSDCSACNQCVERCPTEAIGVAG